jgi:hypothetical protein
LLFEIFVAALCILLFVNMGLFSILMGRRPLMIKAGLVMLPATSLACLVEIIQLYSLDFAGKSTLYSVSAILFILIFTSFLFIVLEFTQRFDPYKSKVFVPLLIVPAMALFAILTDPILHLFTQSQVLVFSPQMQIPILMVTPAAIGFIWIAYFDIVGTLFSLYMFSFIYKDGSKGLAFFFLGGVILIHSYIIGSYFFPDLNAVYPDNLGYAIAAASIYIYSFRFGVFDLAHTSR